MPVNRAFSVMAAVLSAVALMLPTRSQPFTHVTIDGRAIRMLVIGSGASTVVFENGLGGPLEHWGKVQPDVSRFAKTVTYDRAGVGLSAAGPRPRDGRRIAVELHDALRAAGITPPYILVGASLGGPYVRVFAGMYPDDVAGMVLVDPTPDTSQRGDAAGFPELESLPDTLAQARASSVPAGIPVFLIDALSPREVPFATDAVRALRRRSRPAIEAESRAYRKWAETIPGARIIPTEFSGHNVAQEQPKLVIDIIRQVVEQQRQSTR